MAEPTKLTQAQALFAVLAGSAQARRERVYYRERVLKSTLYSPIETLIDAAQNSVSIQIDKMNINPWFITPQDLAINSVTIGVVYTPIGPTVINPIDVAGNSVSIGIVYTSITQVNQPVTDSVSNLPTININKYLAITANTENSLATASVSIGVTKL